MGRLALTLSYDGTGFAGSQVQPGVRTVQGELDQALAALFGRPSATVFAGRTDRGVHAAGQVVGCEDGRSDLHPGVIAKALNARLADDVAVVRVERREATFHARYDARWREYRYRIWAGAPAPLARGQVWQRRTRLDAGSMEQAAKRLVGRHDFASFAGDGEGVPWSERRRQPRGTVRTVLDCGVVVLLPWWGAGAGEGELIELRIAADGFLPQMVRNVAGALVEVGRGRRPPSWIDALLADRDRRAGGPPAPAHGLTFWRVAYRGERISGRDESLGGDRSEHEKGVPGFDRVTDDGRTGEE